MTDDQSLRMVKNTFEELVENLLLAGAWLKVNGETVYGARNWTTTSEGFAKIKQSIVGGSEGRFRSTSNTAAFLVHSQGG